MAPVASAMLPGAAISRWLAPGGSWACTRAHSQQSADLGAPHEQVLRDGTRLPTLHASAHGYGRSDPRLVHRFQPSGGSACREHDAASACCGDGGLRAGTLAVSAQPVMPV